MKLGPFILRSPVVRDRPKPDVRVSINMPPGLNGQAVVDAIREYERRNGKGWRSDDDDGDGVAA